MSRSKTSVRARPPEPVIARKDRGACSECEGKLRVSQPGDALERQADRAADAAVGNGPPPSLAPVPGQLQRQAKPEDEWVRTRPSKGSGEPLAATADAPAETHPRHIRERRGAEAERLRAEVERWKPRQPSSRMPPPRAIAPVAPAPSSAPLEKKREPATPALQRKAKGPGPVDAEPIDAALRESGEALDPATRSLMEARFGRDFSAVRVHAGWRGARASDAVAARAFTLGAHVAFGAGEYRPASESGRRLLAHELAHVVQQGAAPPRSGSTPVAGARNAAPIGASPLASVAGRPAAGTITRAKKPASKADREKIELPVSEELPALVFWVSAADSEGDKLRNFEVDTLALPGSKGPNAEPIYKALAKVGALSSTVKVDDDPQAAFWQKRASTTDLRNRWIDARGWPRGEAANKYWERAGGEAELPKVKDGGVCEMDHIVELQLGGNNTNENIQALDREQNGASGRTLWSELSTLAQAIRDAPALSADDAAQIRMRFAGVKLYGDVEPLSSTCKPKKRTCLAVEKCAGNVKIEPGDKPAGGREPFPLRTIFGQPAELSVPIGFRKAKKDVEILNSTENRGAAELIPGFLLLRLHHTGKHVDACIDTRPKTRLPLSFGNLKAAQQKADKEGGESTATIKFDVVGANNTLQFPGRKKRIPFYYEYLSPGEITELTPRADGVDFTGTITPSVPFLGKLDIAYRNDVLSVTKGLEPDRIKSPLPHSKITKAAGIGVELAPELKATGEIALEYVPGGKKLLDAAVKVAADGEGLRAKGDVHAYLPGVDAHGELEYSRAEGWKGGAKASAAALKEKFKYVRDGEVEIGFRQSGHGATTVDARGKVTLDLPRTQGGVTAELESAGGRWLFRGKGRFDVPRLKPIDIVVTYDGAHLTGEAKNVGFKFQSVDATLDVRYADGKFSGDGTLEFAKGRAKGSLKLALLPTEKFTGEGSVTVAIKEGVQATGAIAIDQNEKVAIRGRLAFVKPIPLFEGFGKDVTLLETGISIPIPGASIGPLGLEARLSGALKAAYHIGPAEIRNAAVETAFNPLEESSDFSLEVGGEVHVGAMALLMGSVTGSIALDAILAEVEGYITLAASGLLQGEAHSNVKFTYAKDRYEVSADFAAALALAIMLTLSAGVRASAGVWRFKVTTEKNWELAKTKFDTGLKLGLRVTKPLKYSSDRGLELPSLSDVKVDTPELDAVQILKDVFHASRTTPEHEV